MANNDLVQQFADFIERRQLTITTHDPVRHHDPAEIFREFINTRGRQHLVVWTGADEGWDMEHPLKCRINGIASLVHCELHIAVTEGLLERYPNGTYRIHQNSKEFHIEKVS